MAGHYRPRDSTRDGPDAGVQSTPTCLDRAIFRAVNTRPGREATNRLRARVSRPTCQAPTWRLVLSTHTPFWREAESGRDGTRSSSGADGAEERDSSKLQHRLP